MKIAQHHIVQNKWTQSGVTSPGFEDAKCQLVLAFGGTTAIKDPDIFKAVKAKYSQAQTVFCSTSGEILNDEVFDDTVVLTAVEFGSTDIRCVVRDLDEKRSSYETGKELMLELASMDLNSVFVISDGTFINGSELIAGFNDHNPTRVPVTGGLAGDGARFEKTFTGLNEIPTQGNVIAIGFYGKNLLMGHGSFGGWDEFGHERTITKSSKNVLYEIDGKSALNLYKEYLGDYAKDLPGSALLFPISLKTSDSEGNVVRTILAVDEEANSMTFAGNMPVGGKVRLMKANFDRLIDGASSAATYSFTGLRETKPQLAILISCVGRKLVLQNRVVEEVDAAKGILGDQAAICGFYSYGEISPIKNNLKCELHNQTMTITTFTEVQ